MPGDVLTLDDEPVSGSLENNLVSLLRQDEQPQRGAHPSHGDTLTDDDEPLNMDPGGDAEVQPARQSRQEQKPSEDDAFFESFAQEHQTDLRSKYKTKAEALKGLANAYRMVGQRNELAELGQRMLSEPADVMTAIAQRLGFDVKRRGEQSPPAPQVTQPAAASAPTKADPEPEWQEEWLDLVSRDNDGNLKGPPDVIAKIQKHEKWAARKGLQVIREWDPQKMIEEARKAAADAAKQEREAWKKEYEQERSQREMLEEGRRLIDAEAHWAYVDGDPSKGPTPQGEVLHKWLKIAGTADPRTGQSVIGNLRMQMDYAKAMAYVELQQSQQQSQPTQQQQNQRRRIARTPDKADRGERGRGKQVLTQSELIQELMNLSPDS